MGYSTEFFGKFETDRVMDESFINYINAFSARRHMKRDLEEIKKIYPHDWAQQCFNGDLGVEGAYFIGDKEDSKVFKYTIFNKDGEDSSVIDYNTQPKGQPGLWCQWIIGPDRKSLVWDNGEKFYNYTEWLEYLIQHFFAPCGYVLNGRVKWQGEDINDSGIIVVTNNNVTKQLLNTDC